MLSEAEIAVMSAQRKRALELVKQYGIGFAEAWTIAVSESKKNKHQRIVGN